MSPRLLLVFTGGVRVAIDAPPGLARGLGEAFTSLFARRYLPVRRIELVEAGDDNAAPALIEWVPGQGFSLDWYRLSDDEPDQYRARGEPPEPYRNESPVFFMLQVAARSYARSGLVLLTDSVTLYDPGAGRAALLLGYPHGGKSTVAALALAQGLRVVSTENTVARLSNGDLEVLGGTEVLLYHPRVEQRYGTKPPVPPSDTTKHGYRVLDLAPSTRLEHPVKITHIYVLHCSFTSSGASLEPVKGRKITKTLWHFASSLIRGDDYYEPHPVSLTTKAVDKQLATIVKEIANRYNNRFYEAYGAHNKVLEKITQQLQQ